MSPRTRSQAIYHPEKAGTRTPESCGAWYTIDPQHGKGSSRGDPHTRTPFGTSANLRHRGNRRPIGLAWPIAPDSTLQISQRQGRRTVPATVREAWAPTLCRGRPKQAMEWPARFSTIEILQMPFCSSNTIDRPAEYTLYLIVLSVFASCATMST